MKHLASAVLAAAFGAGVVPAPALAQRESGSALAAPEDGVQAEEGEAGDSPFGVEILAGTTAPIDVSLGARLVLVDRLLVSGSIGRAAYGSLWSGIARGAIGDAGATLIDPLFEDAWAARLGVGVRPFGQTGIELTVGYARLWTSAAWDMAAAAEVLGWQDGGVSGELTASIGIDAFYVELGLTMKLFDLILLRPAIGWMQTTSARATLSTTMDVPPEMEAMLSEGGAAVGAAIERYGMTPTLSLSAGFEL